MYEVTIEIVGEGMASELFGGRSKEDILHEADIRSVFAELFGDISFELILVNNTGLDVNLIPESNLIVSPSDVFYEGNYWVKFEPLPDTNYTFYLNSKIVGELEYHYPPEI